jgi:hypothetical protein
LGLRPAAAPSCKQVVIRSLKEPREDRACGCRGISSIFGTTGTSIFGDGGGAGGGGLKGDDPGGIIICAQATSPANAVTTVQTNRAVINFRAMTDMS